MTHMPAPGTKAKDSACADCTKAIQVYRESGNSVSDIVEIGTGRVQLTGCQMHRRQARQIIRDSTRKRDRQ